MSSDVETTLEKLDFVLELLSEVISVSCCHAVYLDVDLNIIKLCVTVLIRLI